MRRNKNQVQRQDEQCVIDKLVHGGQGIGTLADGKKVFVWGVLPGETAMVRFTKSKKGWAEGTVAEIITPSPERIIPEEPSMYLSTSPWQIMDYMTENLAKQQILSDVFASEKLDVLWDEFIAPQKRYGYRNKMEYSFWFDTDIEKLSLALHERGSHHKIKVSESVLASDAINKTGHELIEFLNKHGVSGRSLKSVIIRSQKDGQPAVVLYLKDEEFKNLPWADLKTASTKVYFSNPKSPASVVTKLLFEGGAEYLEDKVLNETFSYVPEGFFQVNVPVYESALKEIKKHIDPTKKLVDLYAGVGSIGMSMRSHEIISVESDMACVMQARLNTSKQPDKRIEVVHGESERLLEWITSDVELIVDPPRAGLHVKVVNQIIEQKPERIIYLSCNPSTQARDIRFLVESGYNVEFAQGFNFFPATPHIESLVILTTK